MDDILRNALTEPTLDGFIDTIRTALGFDDGWSSDTLRQMIADPSFTAYKTMPLEQRMRLLTRWLTAEIEAAGERAAEKIGHLVFVYGTLKRGHGNNRLLTGSEFVGEAETDPALYMANGGIPFVWTEGGPLHRVKGEVFRVDDAVLARLDRLEGHPTNYRREEVEVLLGEQRVTACIYLYPHLDRRGSPPAAEVIDDRYVWRGWRDDR
jgi:gamma-glutamylaminecyclotransferase